MTEHEALARQFESSRDHLRAVAYRMLGSSTEADDAVQEAWLRVSRVDADDVDNMGGWLTTIVSRVCLDMLRSRRARAEESLGAHEPEPSAGRRHERGAEADALLADSVGMALVVVLEKLAPAERVAFVLHDMFDLTFDEIAPIVQRSPVAARQLASRARRRVRGASGSVETDRRRQREVVEAFLAASKAGDLEGLIAVLDPDVVVRGDAAAVKLGGHPEVVGAAAVADLFKGRARTAVVGLVDGEVGVHVPVARRMLLVFQIAFADDGRIAAMDVVGDPAAIERLALASLTTDTP
ncbi:MAG TPA: sigma-70 family RNA polymerase sigma factor [Gemmatimonadaceae bacterium]|nr:sigma-70 family RNA polymerase sigma factor [Gemmatimonadaceae bacterium]